MSVPDLYAALLDLLHEIEGTEIRLIVGGGFGILLKANSVAKSNATTLLSDRPGARSTNDLDLFLRPELLIDSNKLEPLSKALERLQYKVFPGAEKFQFARDPEPGADPRSGIKIDILTGPRSCFDGTSARTDNRRVRPNPSVGIHAHPVNEVPTLEDGLRPIDITGQLSSGNPYTGHVYLPHPFSFLMMKLFAFHDRLENINKDFGRYHAFDLFTIVATTIQDEWEHALKLRDSYRDNHYVVQAGDLVSRYFSSPNQLGLIRLKESPYYRDNLQVNDFISVLKELFPLRVGKF